MSELLQMLLRRTDDEQSDKDQESRNRQAHGICRHYVSQGLMRLEYSCDPGDPGNADTENGEKRRYERYTEAS